MTGKHFAQIPVEVLTSDACRTLANPAFRVLIALAAQYRGKNNGDIAMTWADAQQFGVTSKGHLVDALHALQQRGLIQKTRQGGKRPLGPCLYALTWQPIDDLGTKIDSGPTTSAANIWAQWVAPPKDQASSSTGLTSDQVKTKLRDWRQTSTGPTSDQTEAITGLTSDREGQLTGLTSVHLLDLGQRVHNAPTAKRRRGHA